LADGHKLSASLRAISDGLLCPSPPSTYVRPNGGVVAYGGVENTYFFENNGAALVARAASHMAHLLGLTPSHLYEHRTLGGPLCVCGNHKCRIDFLILIFICGRIFYHGCICVVQSFLQYGLFDCAFKDVVIETTLTVA
jgi:hypothetical protein